MKVGLGYDIHRLVEGRELILGGVAFDYPRGLSGHSDADVLLHAIADALLGAVGAGDIGTNFPDTDVRYEGISSIEILKRVAAILKGKRHEIVNIDSVVIAEEPKLAPHVQTMRGNTAMALGIPAETVSVKATTNEGLGETGRKEAIAAYAVVLIKETAAGGPQTEM